MNKNDRVPGVSGEPLDRATVPLIVGICVSAAATKSLELLLQHYQSDPDLAVVIILQHREALDDTQLAKILSGSGLGSPVLAEDGMAVRGGTIYLCATNKITTVTDGHFCVRQAHENPGERATIDSFLVSLAADRAEESIGVFLQGIGSEGTLGVAALKDHGGLTIAEQPNNELSERLADSSSAAALADFILPPQDIPAHLSGYSRHIRRLDEKRAFDELLSHASDALVKIADILQTRTGHDFHGYKQNTFLRRVQRRMHVVQKNDIEEYVEFLRADAGEAQNLFNDLLIGVTQFFRDAKEFAVLESQVIPKIFEGKQSGQQVRVWVLGCATGEEAYSIAILLREHMARLDSVPHVQIFATDIDGRSLASARAGRYRTSIEADVSPERLARWFVREGDTYCIIKELREMCIFSQHNVIKDAPFSKLDLVSCRNLLIYLKAELQNRVIPLFHFALLPDRYLFLGNSENVSRHPKLFAPVDRGARIFRKLETGVRLPPEFPIAALGRPLADKPLPRVTPSTVGLERRAHHIAERYAPAYVIIDDDMQVLHFSARTGKFLDPTAGAASLDLLNLVHRDLRLELRTALHRAMESGEPVHLQQIQLGSNGNQAFVDVTVEPLHDRNEHPRIAVVLFKESSGRQAPDQISANGALVRSEHVERLEGELRATRDRLQATIEELESTNEELKSSNEEYQSLNEELQSANEELETSREELQSVNEELTTVNGELAHRVQELTRATSDLKNFLESTQIATVFLDNDLHVMNFTPAISQILHLVETDIGRPIAHIKARVPIDELFEDVRRVLRTLSSAEREINAPDSETRYIVRILPYRSVDNFIAGVVMTFVDVTPIVRAEERQRMLLAELQHRVRNTLSITRSIVKRTAETSDTVDDFAMHLDGRLSAFARTQALVTRDPEAGVNLETMINEELFAYRTQHNDQALVSGPTVRLQSKPAETLTLAIHELATNAVKYGALSKSTGQIEVTWDLERTDQDTKLKIYWVERGGPPVSRTRARTGFGTELLERTLAYELQAKTTLDFAPTGLHCTIEIPLTKRLVTKPISSR